MKFDNRIHGSIDETIGSFGSCANHGSSLPAVERPLPDPLRVRSKRVLVADDNEPVRNLVCRAFTDAGFEAQGVSNGLYALKLVLHENYDLLVTDHDMPGLAGLGLIRRMRLAGLNLPVIVASAALGTDRAGDYPELRIAALLLKPFDIQELLSVARIAIKASDDQNDIHDGLCRPGTLDAAAFPIGPAHGRQPLPGRPKSKS